MGIICRADDVAIVGLFERKIAACVVAMMMGVHHVLDGFLGGGFDLGQHDLHAAREIAINHQHEILEDNPSLIAVTLGDIALMEIHVGGDLLNLADFIRGQKRTGHRQRRHEGK